jgi:ribonuclease HI
MGFPSKDTYLRRKHDNAASSDPPPMIYTQDPSALDSLEEAFAAAQAKPPPLRYNWTDFAYTDGSCKQAGANWPTGSPGLGAAVYMPAASEVEEDIETPILPHCHQSIHNTINRAELVGIIQAVKQNAPHIATDSLTSMFQIRKQLRRPQDQVDHQHSTLLEQAAKMVEDSDHKITLYKVKGHSHLVGNEKADEIAQGVAKGHIPEESCLEVCTPSNDPGAQYWPYKIRIRPESCRNLYRPLVDLKDAVKATCHEQCKLGMSNCATFYFNSMTKNTGQMYGEPE